MSRFNHEFASFVADNAALIGQLTVLKAVQEAQIDVSQSRILSRQRVVKTCLKS